MLTINITISDEMAGFVDERLRCGAYGSASEVVGGGLDLLREATAVDREKLKVLRREIGLGPEDMRAGRFSDRTVRDIAEAVLREGQDAP